MKAYSVLDEYLRRITARAESQANIKAMILTGSYAQGQSDELSNLDIEISSTDPTKYSDSDA